MLVLLFLQVFQLLQLVPVVSQLSPPSQLSQLFIAGVAKHLRAMANKRGIDYFFKPSAKKARSRDGLSSATAGVADIGAGTTGTGIGIGTGTGIGTATGTATDTTGTGIGTGTGTDIAADIAADTTGTATTALTATTAATADTTRTGTGTGTATTTTTATTATTASTPNTAIPSAPPTSTITTHGFYALGNDEIPPSTHKTYPFPVRALPQHILSLFLGSVPESGSLDGSSKAHDPSQKTTGQRTAGLVVTIPASRGRIIDDQPHLDLLYFEPYLVKTIGDAYFAFLRRELFFYRVEYAIQRGGGGGAAINVKTPRLYVVFS